MDDCVPKGFLVKADRGVILAPVACLCHDLLFVLHTSTESRRAMATGDYIGLASIKEQGE